MCRIEVCHAKVWGKSHGEESMRSVVKRDASNTLGVVMNEIDSKVCIRLRWCVRCLMFDEEGYEEA